jgi:hypothetical protein
VSSPRTTVLLLRAVFNILSPSAAMRQCVHLLTRALHLTPSGHRSSPSSPVDAHSSDEADGSSGSSHLHSSSSLTCALTHPRSSGDLSTLHFLPFRSTELDLLLGKGASFDVTLASEALLRLQTIVASFVDLGMCVRCILCGVCVGMSVCLCVCVFVCLCMCECVCAHVHVCMYVCVWYVWYVMTFLKW